MAKKNILKCGVISLSKAEAELQLKNSEGKTQRIYFSPERPSNVSFNIFNKHIVDFYSFLAEKRIEPEKFLSNCVYAAIGDLDITMKEIIKASKKSHTGDLLSRIENELTDDSVGTEKTFVEVPEDMPDL